MATLQPVSTTELYNKLREHPHNLAKEAIDYEELTGINLLELLSAGKNEEESTNAGLSMKPLEDLAKMLVWAYSSPKRAIITSTGLFVASIHFGLVSLPVALMYILKGIAAGGAITFSSVIIKDIMTQKKVGEKPLKD